MSPSTTTPPVRRRDVLVLVGVGLLSGCSALSNESNAGPAWPMYGYDAGRTGYHPAATGPEDAVEVNWQTRTDGDFLSSPVVAEQTVYVGSSEGRLRAMDVADGTERWSLDLDGAINVPVAVADGVVYAGTTGERLHAVDASGGTSAFGFRFGARRWTTEVDSSVLSPPAVTDERVYAATVAGTLRAFDADSGTVEWEYAGSGKQFSAPAVGDDRVYLNRPAVRRRLVAISLDEGEEVWSFDHGTEGGAALSTPVVADDQVVLGSPDGNIYALDAETGDVRWTVETESPVATTPALTDETAFVGTQDGSAYAIDRRSGETRWTATVADDGGVRAAPAVADGTVYAGTTNGTVGAFDAEDGTPRWQFDVGGEVVGGVVPLDSRLYVQTSDGTLYALGESTKNE